MTQTLFFYDLETSGLSGRDDRIMQFAGQRTDLELRPIGEPVNLLVAMNDDTLPSPDALMVTGVTPQKTLEEGYSEADFCRMFVDEIMTPDTTIVGYNNVRFDDEFMRSILWRNFHDPYEWSYDSGRSRWDLLDVVRMTRALRPSGLEWPVDDKGAPSNRLELLTKANGISHESAHDALSDVRALIELALRIKTAQPDLYNYLYDMRSKSKIRQIVQLDEPRPFVYTSGRYLAEFEKTTVAFPIAEAEFGNVYVYDLRRDPSDWIDKTIDELEVIASTPYSERNDEYIPIPVKKLQYNRCPAIAPLGVLEHGDGWKRVGIEKEQVAAYTRLLASSRDFTERVASVLAKRADYIEIAEAEAQLYDGFIEPRDKLRSEAVRNAGAAELKTLKPEFDDDRLREMFPRYKARNFPASLSGDERTNYETYRAKRIERQAPEFLKRLESLLRADTLTSHQQFVLEELKLWYESVAPSDTDY